MAEITLMWDKARAKSTAGIGREYAETIGRGNTTVGDLMIESQALDGKTTAVFEDNGKVAYCYILEGGKIVADVWLYNREKAPRLKPWVSGGRPPYLNPAGYSTDISTFPQEGDINIQWDSKDDIPIAVVTIFGKIFGYISALTKPGYARLALKDGPLARAMQSNMLAR